VAGATPLLGMDTFSTKINFQGPALENQRFNPVLNDLGFFLSSK